MTIMTLDQIKAYLPHRYPFLFIDAVDDLVLGESIRARKAVTGNEGFFNGHFPGNPVLPGVLQIEAMGQAGALLAILSGAKVDADHFVYVTSISDCKFRRPVVPGDVMTLSAKVIRTRLGAWRLGCETHVGDELASTATVTATSGPRPRTPGLPDAWPRPMFGDLEGVE